MIPVNTLRHVHDCCGNISRLVGVLGYDRPRLVTARPCRRSAEVDQT
jgi:hypothetical protein